MTKKMSKRTKIEITVAAIIMIAFITVIAALAGIVCATYNIAMNTSTIRNSDYSPLSVGYCTLNDNDDDDDSYGIPVVIEPDYDADYFIDNTPAVYKEQKEDSGEAIVTDMDSWHKTRKVMPLYSSNPIVNANTVEGKTLRLRSNATANSIANKPIVHQRIMEYWPIVKKASQNYGVPADWIYAIMLEESMVNPNADGKAIGLMQLEKSVFVNQLHYTVESLKDPATNIDIATKFLGDYLKASNNNIYEALGRYGRGASGWNEKKRSVGIINRNVSSYEEAVYLQRILGDINFIEKMEKEHRKFNMYYEIV